MSLDNIQLPAIVLQGLFKNVLIDLDTATTQKVTEKPAGIAFLGKNQKQITIVTNNESTIYLPDEELNFLMGVLSACTLSMADVALINIAKKVVLTYNKIQEELNGEIVLLFGVEPMQLQLPLKFPQYQIQKFNTQVYLSAPMLSAIAADKTEKTKLWNCLKEVFSIA